MAIANQNTLIGNPAVLKRVNRVRILNSLRLFGPDSRAELAAGTGLDAKTITNVCNDLLEEGLILTKEPVACGRGRPAGKITLNNQSCYAIGVDIGARQITAVLIDLSGNVISKWHQDYNSSKRKTFVLKKVSETIQTLSSTLDQKQQKKIQGIGICIPGLLNRADGVVIQAVNMPGFKNISVTAGIKEKFSRTVILEESSRAMAIGELWFGNHGNAEDFICIDAGFGIGMGIMHNGRLYRGANEVSGEIGHTVVDAKGLKCTCGKKGCLETIASGRALGEFARLLNLEKYGIKSKDAKAVFQAAVLGDLKAKKALAKAGESIGIAIANVINLFDPGFVILNGGLTEAGALLIEPLKRSVQAHCVRPFRKNYGIEVSRLGKLAGALGAAMLPLKEFFEFENIRF